MRFTLLLALVITCFPMVARAQANEGDAYEARIRRAADKVKKVTRYYDQNGNFVGARITLTNGDTVYYSPYDGGSYTADPPGVVPLIPYAVDGGKPVYINLNDENDDGIIEMPEFDVDARQDPLLNNNFAKAVASMGNNPKNDQCSTGEGTNPFKLDGNVTREITDLTMTGSEPLSWIRYNNSIPRAIVPAFGQGASWRHNWQYELQAWSNEDGEHLLFIYPSGIRRTFDRQADGSFATLHERYQEKARLDGDQVIITTQDENTLVFAPVSAPAAHATAGIYRPVTITNKNGLVTAFDYDNNGLLQHITSDAGNQITLYYEEHAGQPCISRVETSDGRAVDYEYKNMSVMGSTGSLPVTSGKTDSLSDILMGLDFQPDDLSGMDVISIEVPEYATLARAHYGDGTSAEYKYAIVTPGRAPLLVEADDPRYNGRATHIGYRYNTAQGYGVIHQEFNPDTLQPYASLEFDPNDPEKRIVNYTDDRAITYRVPEGTNGRPTERVDSLGRKRTWSYANGGAESSEGETLADGRSFKYTRDKNGKITRSERNDGLVLDIEYNQNGKITKTKDNRGHSAEYVRDAKDRVTQSNKTNNGKGNSNGNGNNGNPNSNNGVGPNGTPPGKTRKQAFVYDDAGRLLRADYADGTYEEVTRNNKGNILAKRDRKGGLHHYTLAERGLVASETDPAGATTSYTYDQYGQRISQTDALGHTTAYERDERGLVTKQTNPDGATHLYSYDKYGRKIGETDELGRVASWEYDSLGRLTSQTDFAGGVTRFDYTETPGGCGTCSLVSNPTRITYPEGRIDEFLYDSEGRKLMAAVAVGTAQMATTLYAYDEANNLIKQTNPDGGVIRNTYDIDSHRLSTIDTLGRTTSWTYDTDGNILSQTDPSGRATDNAYDADNNLIYTVTADGAETTYTYDDANRRISATDALGNTTHWNYDDVGNLASVIDAAGSKTTYAYDSAGRRTRAKLPDNTSQTWSYNAIGQITQTQTADGLEVTNEYDTMGRLTATTATPGHVGASLATPSTTRVTYDLAGRRTSVTDSLNRTTTYDYNAANQVTTTTNPDGTQTQKEYDAAGRVLADIDQLGHATRYTYTAMGDTATLTDANGNTYAFQYDLMRRKTAMTYPDDTEEQWAYDLGGRLATYTTRAGQVKTSAYNLDGKPLSETWHPSNCAPDVTYTYDETTGRLASTDNGNALLAYTYDKLGRVATETTNLNTNLNFNLNLNLPSHTVGYQYDALGRKAGLIYPSGTKVTYTYDAQGRLTEVYNGGHKPLATYEYDAFGRRSKLTRDNGVVTNYTYDTASQVLAIDHLDKSNKGLAFVNYEYDNMGRRTAMTRENLQTDTYRYDPAGQLVGVDYVGASLATPASGNNGNGNNGNPNSNNGKGNGNSSSTSSQPVSSDAAPLRTETFAYDPAGNRLDHTDTGDVDTQPPLYEHYETNDLNQYTQITQDSEGRAKPPAEPSQTDDEADDSQNPTVNSEQGTVNLAHDSNGNLTDDGNQLYRYDAQNRLVEVESATGKAVFAYDALNRCILRQYYTADSTGVMTPDAAASVVMTYDIAWNILSDRTLSGRQTAEYVHGNRVDEVLVQIRDSEFGYPLSDAINSTIMLVGQNDNSLGVYHYDAFGKPSGEDLGYRFLYTGREWLQSFSLNDHRNRYYNPSTGRWLNTDPIRFKGGLNIYAYAYNSPTNYIDPVGLSFCCPDLCSAGQKKVIRAYTSTVPYGAPYNSRNRVEAISGLFGVLGSAESATGLLTGAQAVNGFGSAAEEVAGYAGTSADDGYSGAFQYAGNKVLDLFSSWGGFTVYAVIEYSTCESESCFVFWSRLNWGATKTATKGKPKGSGRGTLIFLKKSLQKTNTRTTSRHGSQSAHPV